MRTVRAILVVVAVGFLMNGVALADEGYSYSGTDAIADSGPFGIGFGSAGMVSGLSGKLLLGDSAAFQGVVGWGTWLGLAAALDYTMDVGNLADVEPFRLNWYAGAGGSLGLSTWSGMNIGLSAVLGLSFRLRALPIELTAEVRPTFLLGSWASSWGGLPFRVWGGGAIRWYL